MTLSKTPSSVSRIIEHLDDDCFSLADRPSAMSGRRQRSALCMDSRFPCFRLKYSTLAAVPSVSAIATNQYTLNGLDQFALSCALACSAGVSRLSTPIQEPDNETVRQQYERCRPDPADARDAGAQLELNSRSRKS